MEEAANTQSALARVSWTITTVACLVAALIVLLKGDTGYAIVCFVVAISAAINLL